MKRLVLSLIIVGISLTGCGKIGEELASEITNHAPAIRSLTASPASVVAGSSTSLVCDAYDDEGDSITYSWSAVAGVLSSTAGSSVSWTAPSTAGAYTINVQVSDGKASNVGSVSVIVTSTTSEVSTPPSTPTNLIASDITDISAKLTWEVVSNAASYKVSYGTNSGASNLGVFSCTNNGYVLSSLTPDASYYVKVLAENSAGSSSYSSIESFTTESVIGTTIPSTPTNLVISDIIDISANISWEAVSDASIYKVSYGTDSNATNLGVFYSTDNNCSLSSLIAGTNYYVKVLAENSEGSSSYSTIKSFTSVATTTTTTTSTTSTTTLSTTTIPNTTSTTTTSTTTTTTTTTSTTTTTISSSWQTIGSVGFSTGAADMISLSVDDSDTPYIVYRDGSAGSKLTVKKYNGSSWQTLGSEGFTQGACVFTTSICLYDNNVFVSGVSEGVYKYNGSSWDWPLAIVNSYPALFVYEGTPYLAYDNGSYLSVKKYNGSVWEVVGTANISSGGVGQGNSIFVYQGNPYVSYCDEANGNRLTVKRYDGSSWQIVGSEGFSDGTVSASKIIVDTNGNVYVAYVDSSLGIVIKKYNGSSWITIGSFGGWGGGNQIAFSVYSGVPYIVCKDPWPSEHPFFTLKEYSGGTWISNRITQVTTLSYWALAIHNGTPYVAYRDGSNSNKATVMKYE